MTVTSSWICPNCGVRNMYTEHGDNEYMKCKCPDCKAKFAVHVWSTDIDYEDEE